MRILFLTRAYGQHAGGMERLSYELIQNVKSLPGVEVEVVAHRGSRPTSPFFNLMALPKALAAARRADVIHLGDPMLSLLGWKIQKLTGKSIAVTVHGLDITYPNFFYQLYLKAFFKGFKLYLPISRYVQKLLTTHYNLPPEKISIINPGISDRFYDPSLSRQDLEKLLGRNLAGKKVLFTSGRLVKRKGHEWFLREVLPKLPENVIYVIAGDGPEKDKLERLARPHPPRNESASPSQGEAPLLTKERSATSRVRYLGKVSDKDLKILYNTVDAFIMPNIPVKNDVEGFGLVLLEAALCNRPIFAANLEGLPDAIQHKQNGTLLPPQGAPAWVQALQNIPMPSPSTRNYTLARFSWEKTARAITKNLSAATLSR